MISGVIEFSVVNTYLVHSMELLLDDVPMNLTDNTTTAPYGPLSPGPHNITLSAVGSYGGEVSLQYEWTIAVNFVDLFPVSGSVMAISNQLVAYVDQFTSSAVLRFSLPQPPALGESVTVTCVSNDSNVGIVSSRPALVSGPPSGNVLVLSGVPYYFDDGSPFRPFAVKCHTTSVLPPDSPVQPVYENAVVRAVTGECNRTLWPLFQDVLVRSDEGLWVPSLSGNTFSLTVSKNVTALFIGDVMFRSRGPHFTNITTVSVGNVSATVLNYSSDVRLLLQSLNLPSYSGLGWNTPVDAMWVVFPGYNTSCVSSNGTDACVGNSAYKTITLSNPGAGSISCPPLCPGVSESSIGGAFYTPLCVGYNRTGAACLDPSTAHLCALGSGDTCQPCPVGGICPGGNRLW